VEIEGLFKPPFPIPNIQLYGLKIPVACIIFSDPSISSGNYIKEKLVVRVKENILCILFYSTPVEIQGSITFLVGLAL